MPATRKRRKAQSGITRKTRATLDLRAALRAALDEEPPPPTDGDYIMPFGQYKGSPIGSLPYDTLEWLAHTYVGKDKTLAACARAVLQNHPGDPRDGGDFDESELICAGREYD